MFLHALTTAVPHAVFTQKQCAEIVQRSRIRDRLARRSLLTLQAVLRGDSGVNTRHFATAQAERLFDLSPDELNEYFRHEAPRLANEALRPALEQTGTRTQELDALLVCTCTGYLCPGLTSYMSEQLGLRENAILQDLVGLGCGAAIPMLRSAEALLARHPDALVATVAVEVCSAAFFLDDDPGVLISACLFGDGAAAALWRSRPPDDRPALRCHGFTTRHVPAHRDRIRFEQRDGKLRNLLDLDLAPLAADAVAGLWRAEQDAPCPPRRIISHGGGRDVLDALERALPGQDLQPARLTLRDYGNMSSPSVLFALERALRDRPPDAGADWWLVSFGAGFSVHGCRLGRPPADWRAVRPAPAGPCL